MTLPGHSNLARMFSANASSWKQIFLNFGSALLLTITVWLQLGLDHQDHQEIVQIERLAQLPSGELLKPVLLGYHHLGADILWLRLIQVIGEKRNTTYEYEWMSHTLDVITTLDPQYVYAYYVGGVILGDLAHRPDISNRLLAKGAEANPTVWNLPFLLGYNHYFLMDDAAKAAEHIMRAAKLPDGPSYLPGLATRMAAEGGKPETALVFLNARLRETKDPEIREFYINRMKEITIERDIRILEEAVDIFTAKYRTPPMTLIDLVRAGIIPLLPPEPFGGTYRFDPGTGTISSSTHPERLRTFYKRKREMTYPYPKVQQPTYVFPKTW